MRTVTIITALAMSLGTIGAATAAATATKKIPAPSISDQASAGNLTSYLSKGKAEGKQGISDQGASGNLSSY